MSVTALAFLCLTITTAIVSGNQYECEFNLARNQFFGNQVCFSADQLIRQNLIQFLNDSSANLPAVNTLVTNTLCNGQCGNALNRIVYYADRVLDRSIQFFNFPELLIAEAYCVREDNRCWEIPEDLVNEIRGAFLSSSRTRQGECTSLPGTCSTDCQGIIERFVVQQGCCARASLDLIRFLFRNDIHVSTSSMFASCGISDPGPCQSIGEIGLPVSSVSSDFKVISYDTILLLVAVMLPRLFWQ